MLTSTVTDSEAREQVNRQAGRIQRLEEDLKAANALVRIIDRDLPVMLAFLDADQYFRFHNQAYRRWLGMSAEQISGHTMREVLGEPVYAEIAERIRAVLAGTAVRYERTHATPAGGAMRVHVHLVPSFNDRREVSGFYSLVIDHTEASPGLEGPPAATDDAWLVRPLDPADDAEGTPELSEGEVARGQDEWRLATERIRSAISNDEFQLYCQAIRDLAADVPPFYGIFVRQTEEEENMMPPGAFFALAEEYGLMTELDRWVVGGVLAWAAERQRARPEWRPSMYCINLSRDSIGDPYFPDFVHEQATRHGVPAEALCFEVTEGDAVMLAADAAEMSRNLRAAGCRIMLGGFGRERISFELLKELHVDFLKIDGSIILNINRSDASLARLRGIVRLAHTVGINTVAELVESEEIVQRLREMEVDYAHGFAVSGALPLDALP